MLDIAGLRPAAPGRGRQASPAYFPRLAKAGEKKSPLDGGLPEVSVDQSSVAVPLDGQSPNYDRLAWMTSNCARLITTTPGFCSKSET